MRKTVSQAALMGMKGPGSRFCSGAWYAHRSSALGFREAVGQTVTRSAQWTVNSVLKALAPSVIVGIGTALSLLFRLDLFDFVFRSGIENT